MSSLMFGTFFVLVVATVVFYFAPGLAGHGNHIAVEVCSLGRMFCQHPEYAAMAAGGAGVLWLILRISGR